MEEKKHINTHLKYKKTRQGVVDQSEEKGKASWRQTPPAESPTEQVRVKSEGVIKPLPTQKQGHSVPSEHYKQFLTWIGAEGKGKAEAQATKLERSVQDKLLRVPYAILQEFKYLILKFIVTQGVTWLRCLRKIPLIMIWKSYQQQEKQEKKKVR